MPYARLSAYTRQKELKDTGGRNPRDPTQTEANMTAMEPMTPQSPDSLPVRRWRTSDLEAEIGLAARYRARVLITAPVDRALPIVQAIAARHHGGVNHEIISCDAEDADRVIPAVKDRAGKIGKDRSPILWVKDPHRFSTAQQAILLQLIDDTSRQPTRIPRVIASSNVDLFDRVRNGSFDARLFYLINSIHIVVTPTNAWRTGERDACAAR